MPSSSFPQSPWPCPSIGGQSGLCRGCASPFSCLATAVSPSHVVLTSTSLQPTSAVACPGVASAAHRDGWCESISCMMGNRYTRSIASSLISPASARICSAYVVMPDDSMPSSYFHVQLFVGGTDQPDALQQGYRAWLPWPRIRRPEGITADRCRLLRTFLVC